MGKEITVIITVCLLTGAAPERRVSATVPLPLVQVTEAASPIDESPVVARR